MRRLKNVFINFCLPQRRSNKTEDLEENRSLGRISLNHAGIKENGNGRIIKVKCTVENPSKPGGRKQKSVANKGKLKQAPPLIIGQLNPIEEVSGDFL